MHINGGAYRRISVEEWRSLGGDDNKFCDWHEGVGYVVYDDLALAQYLAKTNVKAPAPAAPTATTPPVSDNQGGVDV